MPAQHQDEYCHVDVKTGEILEGPMALPQNWGSVAGFWHLKGKDLLKHNWYLVRNANIPARHEAYTLLFLPEHQIVLRLPASNEVYRGSARYATHKLYTMFSYFALRSFYSPVLALVHRFPNTQIEQVHRQNCLIAKQDYTCMAETLGKEYVRVTVPHEKIKTLIADAVVAHNQQLEKLFTGLKDIQSATSKELVAILDTDLDDYYG